ncbi:MAG TPA: DUF302 domain-containing protein [Ktedonobacterales bacterium]
MDGTNSATSGAANTPPPSAPGVITKSSPHSVPETIERLQRTIHAKGLTLFAHIDHSAAAREVGLTMQEAHVLIFGSPKAGTPLMVATPLVALDLPLRALVWQDNDGHSWVSYNSTTYLAERYGIPDALTKNIAGIDALVDAALHTAVE